MKSINSWRIAALVFLGLNFTLGYTIWVSIQDEQAIEPYLLPQAIQAAQPPGSVAPGTPRYLPLAPWPEVAFSGSTETAPLDLEHDYDFERDWHERHARYWTEALERFRGKAEVRYLEVGLFEGASFFWVIEKILTHPSSHATGIDPFFREYSEIRNYGDTFYDNLKLSGASDRSTIIQGFSQTELRKLPLNSYDIIYIDGSHTARDVLEDAILSWRLLKPCGILIFDDYELWWDRAPAERPRLGIDVFHTFYAGEFTVEHFAYQVMMSRTSGCPTGS